MDSIRRVPLKEAALRKAIDAGEEFALLDGDTAVARVIPVAAEVRRNEKRFLHYPHEGGECLYTCWRHQPGAQDAPAETDAAAAAAPTE